MSRHDEIDPDKIEAEPGRPKADDERSQLNLRLALDRAAAAEEQRLNDGAPIRPTSKQLWQLASRLYEGRRGRDRLFNDQLLGEPAWDMLLALYCFPRRGIFLGVTSLSHAANVSPSTGSRWQSLLLEEGLIERGPDVSDTRVQLVRLSEAGKTLMNEYLTRLFYCDGKSSH